MDIPRKAILSFLGKHVHVVVDRPMGCLHKDILYTLNYGFLPGVPGGDGEDQDAYILGVNPFNQPGVEDYKRNMFALLGKPGFDS